MEDGNHHQYDCVYVDQFHYQFLASAAGDGEPRLARAERNVPGNPNAAPGRQITVWRTID
jgi:hypothetical protein